MKPFLQYFNDVIGTKEELSMKPRKIMAEQTNNNDALWNSENDRWSRRAKHPLRINEISTDKQMTWEKGDFALYEEQAVEIVIPKGPNGTIGIIFEGSTKMVLGSKLTQLDEGVLGSMLPLNPINRIMQLAGLAVPQIVGEDQDTSAPNESALTEDTGNMFDALYRANFAGEFKNNPDAARVATIGQILVGLQSQISELQGKLSPDLTSKVNMVAGIGALLLRSAKGMTQDTGQQGI